MTTNPTPALTVIPQGFPLWAVRATSGPGSGDTAGVGLVVGWEPDPDGDSAVLAPLVAEIAAPELADIVEPGPFAGGALPWRAEPSRDPRLGFFERVEVHATREDAVGRARPLLDEVRGVWALWDAAASVESDAEPIGLATSAPRLTSAPPPSR